MQQEGNNYLCGKIYDYRKTRACILDPAQATLA